MMNIIHKIILLTATLGTLTAAPITINFSDSDLDQFTNTSPSNWSIGAGNGFLTAQHDGDFASINGSYYGGGTFLFANNGDMLVMEAVYKWNGVNISANGTDVLRIGISTTTSNDPLPQYSGVLRATASGNRNHRVGNYSGTNLVASAANTNITNSAQDMILRTTFTRVNETTLDMATTFLFANSGNPQIDELTRTVTVSAGYFDSPVYAGLFVNGDGQRTTTSNWTSTVNVESFSMEFTAIPEPGTLALVGIALGSVLLFRRRLS
jgi:hypothetical protein